MHRIWSRGRQFWSETRWILVGIFWLVGLVLGYAGFALYARDQALDWSASDVFYRTLQLIILESGSVGGQANWMLEIARFLLPALTAYTAFQAVMHLFQEQTQWLRLWWLRDHVVVCGLGRKGSHLVSELLDQGRPVVAIEKDLGNERVATLRRQGAIVLAGDATDPAVLTGARLQRTRHLISLLGQDGPNLRVAVQAYGLTRGRQQGRLTCMIHLNSLELLDLIKNSELTIDTDVPFQLESFNAYARAARLLLQADPGWQATAPGEEIAQRVLVIGMGRLGENLVRHAAYTWHLLKRQAELHITVLDRDAEQKVAALLRKHPQISETCRLIPLEIDLCAIDLLHERLQIGSAQQPIDRVYICLSDPLLSLQVCLNLVRLTRLLPGSILVRLAGDCELSDLMRNPLPGLADTNQVKTFDIYEQTCSADLLVSGSHELLARDLHAVYLAGTGEAGAGPDANLPWEQLSEEAKEANRQQADRIHRLLQSAGYSISPLQDWDAAERAFQEEEIVQMGRLEHELWRQAKEANGWRYGKQKDNERRIHPDLVAWEALEDTEREKNLAFVRQLPALLARVGFQIDRMESI
jgi:hypothetical protein